MSKRTTISPTSISRLKNQYQSVIYSDDNDILELQKKKLKLNPSSLDIKDNGDIQSVSPPIRFSIQVEVDRIDTDNIVQNSCFTRSKTDSSSQEDVPPGTDFCKHTEKQPSYKEKKNFYIRKLLSSPPKVCERKNHTIVKQYAISTETIMKAIQEQSIENTEAGDKCLDIFCRNLHGVFKNLTLSFIDEEVNRVIKVWSKWFKMYPMFRDTPLMYKCYICCKGWWRLHPFKEHLKEHEDLNLRLRTESVYHVFNIIATAKQVNINNVSMDSNCWKCGRDIGFHIHEHNSAKYHCRGCKKSMVTCHRLKEHESMCMENIELMSKEHNIDPSEGLSCTICNIRCVNEHAMDAHLTDYHLVRSDEPAVVETKLCRYCNGRYSVYTFHECPAQTKPYKCNVCCRTFSSLISSQIHMEYSRDCVVKCMVCFKDISQCMVLEHHLKHSKNYCLLNMCYECDTGLLFDNDQTNVFMNHMETHSPSYSSGQILLPIKCLNGEFLKSETTFQIPDENLDNFMAGLEESKGIPIDIDTDLQEEVQSITHAIDVDSDVIILDDDNDDDDVDDLEPPDELTLNSQNVDDNEFDIKTMEAQLDEEIMRDLEMEVTINKLFQASDSYRLLMRKESIDRKSEENELMNNKSNMEHLVQKESIENELFENESAEKEFMSEEDEVIDLVKDNLCDDVKILDHGVENVTSINYSESEETQESDLYTLKQDLNMMNNINDDLDSSVEKETDSESEDIVIDSSSNDSEKNSDWNISTIVKEEPSNNIVEFVTESEIFIQEKIKIESSEDLPHKMCDELVANEDESAETHSKNQLYECKRCEYRGEWYCYIMHVSTECPDTKFSCCLCKGCVLFDNINHYLKHLSVHDYRPLSCPECNIVQKSSHKLCEHVKDHIQTLYSHTKSALIGDKSLHHCKICGDAVQLENFFEHWQTHLNSPYSDPIEEEFSEDSTEGEGCIPMSPEVIKAVLDSLQSKGRGCNVTQCIVCLRKTTRWQEYKRHLIEHLLSLEVKERSKRRDGVLKCYFCDDVFKKAYDWKFHMRSHCQMKEYKCGLCSKMFSDSSNLSKHRKAHNEFLCLCDLCNAKFHSKHHMIQHLRRHESELKCPKCDKAFPRQGKLRIHLAAKHQDAGYLKHKCGICAGRYISWKELMKHMWRKHDKRKAVADCPICGAPFRKITDVNWHIKTKHTTFYKPTKKI